MTENHRIPRQLAGRLADRRLALILALLLLLALGVASTALAAGQPAASRPTAAANPRSAEFNAILQGSQPAQAVQPSAQLNNGCLQDVSVPPLNGLNCTSNDVTLAIASIVSITDPCTGPGDTATFTANITAISGASERYDLGMYFASDGGGADGALTGQCTIANLDITNPATGGRYNLEGATSTGKSCGGGPTGRVCTKDSDCAGQPAGQTTCVATGPAADTCGDIKQGETATQAVTMTVMCQDPDADGKLNVPYCAAWSNQAQGSLCRSPNQAIPETAAKCRCDPAGLTVDVPVPPITMTMDKEPENLTLKPGETFNYTLTYSNQGDGVANTNAIATNIVVTDDLPPNLRATAYSINGGVGTCSPSVPTAYGALITCSGLPNLNEGESNFITITVQADPTQGTPQTQTNTACVDGKRLNFPNLPASHVCDDTSVTTPVTVAYFSATAAGGGTRFEWTTATETGNVGFNLYEQTADGYKKLNDALIPSTVVDATAPTDYSFTYAGVPQGDLYIEDVDLDGGVRNHGPFTVGVPFGERIALEAINWAAVAESNAQAVGAASVAPAAANVADLRVKQDGIYRVTYEQLLAKGVNFNGVAGTSLALTNRGVPVAIFVSKATFGPGAYIEFIGQGLDTIYTDANVYKLQVNANLAKRVAISRTLVPRNPVYPAYYMETALVENNAQYSYRSPNGDPWFDYLAYVQTSTPNKTKDFTVSIDNYAGAGAASSVALNLWGLSDEIAGQDHHAVVSVNGNQVADVKFDATEIKHIAAQLPAGTLVEGANTVRLTVPVDMGVSYDMMAVESYGLTYPRAFRATSGRLDFAGKSAAYRVTGLNSNQVVVYRVGTGRPVRLNGAQVQTDGAGYRVNFVGGTQATYYVSTAGALLTPDVAAAPAKVDIKTGPADVLIIANPNFLSGIQPLAQARRDQGYSVKVVDVNQVYAQFSGGVFDAQAIRGYIKHAAANMGTEYVILVGGDTTDYRDYLNKGSISFIPSLYAPTIEGINLAPVDPLYADTDGNNVPNVAIGRFPVRTAAELQMMVDKTLAYTANANPGTVTFAADNGFTADSESFAQHIGNGMWFIERNYMSMMGNAEARAALLDDLNGGPRLASFVGHSSAYQWTVLASGALFNYKDAAALTNTTPMVVSQWGCWNTYYVDPSYSTLGHKFLLSGSNGAAAVTGSTTLTNSNSERALGDRMMPLMTTRGMPMGAAMLSAKQDLAQTHPEMLDVLLGWTILGDPTLVVQP